MAYLSYVLAWIGEKLGLEEKGQATTEYVLLILGVVTFLIVAALLLKDSLSTAVSEITSWVKAITPAVP